MTLNNIKTHTFNSQYKTHQQHQHFIFVVPPFFKKTCFQILDIHLNQPFAVFSWPAFGRPKNLINFCVV